MALTEPAARDGIHPPTVSFPIPGSAEDVTANLLLQIRQAPNPRLRFIHQVLIKHLHAFAMETKLSTEELIAGVQFLTRLGQESTPMRPDMLILCDLLGLMAVVDYLNNPVMGGATEGSPLGPFYTEDAEEVKFGESIASEGKGEYMYVEGRVLTTEKEPIAGAVIETWLADGEGLYDVQYADRTHPDCRGRLRTATDGSFGYRAVVPGGYPVPLEGAIGELMSSQGRVCKRPSHVHITVEAPGYRKLVTALYPEDDAHTTVDVAFGVKKSLVVKLEQVDDNQEARKRGFPEGGSFKLLKYDFVLLTEEQSSCLGKQLDEEREELLYLQVKNMTIDGAH